MDSISKVVPVLECTLPGEGDVSERGNGTGNRSSGLAGCRGGAAPPVSKRKFVQVRRLELISLFS